MAKFSCFSLIVGKKKKDKGHGKPVDLVNVSNGNGTTPLKLEIPAKILPIDGIHEMLGNEYPLQAESVETDYEGGDEHDEKFSIKREFSDFDLQAHATDGVEEENPTLNGKTGSQDHINADENDNDGSDAEAGIEFTIQSGHASDPGIGRAEFWASPLLQRSCSNLETGQVLQKIANQLPPSKSQSYEDLENLKEKMAKEVVGATWSSPLSVMTPCSADRVMLKKHSSSQVLPSRSRKLWWKLFLWSHRNLHKSKAVKPKPLAIDLAFDQKGGYCSDTLETVRGKETSGSELGGSCSKNNKVRSSQELDNFQDRVSGLWPSNQWLAFSSDPTSLTRMWIDSLEEQPLPLPDEEDTGDERIVFPPSPEAGLSPMKSANYKAWRSHGTLSEDVLQANNVIQSLNLSSRVAHIAGMNLKVIPNISSFSSLRSVNLSGNFIVRISPGSLPKGIHTLNLSRNKIATIEGLRELTRLRVLDLSYNRISRIGQGLSNCTLIKELYIAGNKISEVEGLHRLLKLTVLDLSFNKITTTKALGQLVANYNSLLALNLLGNPIQSNIGDDQLRKMVPGLLPQLTYLNKQPIKPQRAREVTMDSVAKAAIGGSGMTRGRRVPKRVSQSGGSTSIRGRNDKRNGLRSSRHKSKNSNHRHVSSTK